MKQIRQYILFVILGLLMSQWSMAAEYKVVVRAHHGIDDAFRQWNPTLEVLSKQLAPHKFILIPIISLNEITRRVGQGEFDFVLTNPSSYIEIEELYQAKGLVTLNNKRANTAQDHFGAVIFTHVKNTDILTIKDLKGKTLMAVSEPAFGGWRVAWYEMLKQGFDPYHDLKKLIFTKSHIQPDVVRAVRDGKVNAGVVRTDRLERMEEDGEIDMRYFRIINNKEVKNFPFFLSTALYPEWVFAAVKSSSGKEDVSEKIKKTLLHIKPATTAAKSGKYMGWVELRDYSSVRQLMQRLKVGPYKNNADNH